MNDHDIEIAQQIGKLQGIVEEGFKNVHIRQDISNGRTAKLEVRMEKLEKERTYESGTWKGYSNIKGFILTTISLLVALASLIAFLKK